MLYVDDCALMLAVHAAVILDQAPEKNVIRRTRRSTSGDLGRSVNRLELVACSECRPWAAPGRHSVADLPQHRI